ncbi:hypothetical protein D3C80_1041600 [compost metagenome]
MAGLCQKILVVNKHLAVAFAGDVLAIKIAVEVIDDLVKQSSNVSGMRLVDALQADPVLKKANLAVIALIVEGEEIQVSQYGASFGTFNEHFELWVGGTGADHAIEHFDGYPPEAFDVAEDDIVITGTCMALHQFANQLIAEFDDEFESESIANLFGGGYEVLAFYGGRFQKVPNVVYAFAEAEMDAEGILQIDYPKFLLKSTYVGDDLKIRSVEVEQSEDYDLYIPRNDRSFTIAPITRWDETKVDENCQDVKFYGDFLCFIIKVNTQSDSFTIPFIRKYRDSRFFMYEGFIASVSEDEVHIGYSDVFLKELEGTVFDYYGQMKAMALLEKPTV